MRRPSTFALAADSGGRRRSARRPDPLLTGEYAWRKPGTGVLPGDARLIIAPGRVTLPSMLKARGYRTAAIGKWHLGLGDGQIDWNGERDQRVQPAHARVVA